ncbi:unnamed protein product [Cuscuta campestris]|uniref:F-box domain-containing protein n=1 Tax=Cuscuta campestris TaxID=132261 RepID=A0A484KVR0_9ASTE|nr:unnamed protein product [Cuscuta campestris]
MMALKEHRPFPEIPSALLCEILGRLPIKTCLTCKLVCKEWYHAIASPEFSSFLCRFMAPQLNVLFCCYSGATVRSTFNLIGLEKGSNADDSGNCIVGADDRIRFKPKFDISSEILYVCYRGNGVVLLVCTKDDYFVCNLLAGQWMKLQNLHQVRDQSYDVSRCELGCCPVSGQFKVLVLLWDVERKIQLAKIQTLGDGEWRSVGNSPLKIVRGGCFLNGSSHWRDDKSIWSFHFGEERFSPTPIPFPDDVISEAYKKKSKILCVFDYCLCLRCSSCVVGDEIDVWIMKEYGVKESWVRQFVIVNDPWSVPLMHMDKGKILVESGNKLYLYDPQTRVSKTMNFDGLSG